MLKFVPLQKRDLSDDASRAHPPLRRRLSPDLTVKAVASPAPSRAPPSSYASASVRPRTEHVLYERSSPPRSAVAYVTACSLCQQGL